MYILFFLVSIGMQLIKSFSLYETLPKMLDSSPKPNQLQALDGIRFLSMTWVILGHVYILPMLPGLIRKLKVLQYDFSPFIWDINIHYHRVSRSDVCFLQWWLEKLYIEQVKCFLRIGGWNFIVWAWDSACGIGVGRRKSLCGHRNKIKRQCKKYKE